MKKVLSLFVATLFLLCACSKTDLSQFSIISTREYAQDGRLCMAYRVVCPANTRDSALLEAAKKVLNDGYYLHTIWFYRSVEETSGGYTVGMIEQTNDGRLTLYRNGQRVEPHTDDSVTNWSIGILSILLLITFTALPFAMRSGHKRDEQNTAAKKGLTLVGEHGKFLNVQDTYFKIVRTTLHGVPRKERIFTVNQIDNIEVQVGYIRILPNDASLLSEESLEQFTVRFSGETALEKAYRIEKHFRSKKAIG